MRSIVLVIGVLGQVVLAHVAAWHKGMYCLNGTTGEDDENTNEAVNPLYMLSREDWWFHHVNRCDEFPPAPGDFLELPAGGNFTVELAVNRAATTLSYGGMYTGEFGDGQDHPGLGVVPDGQEPPCITDPNIHTQNESMAAGTAFAISYQSDISEVTPENLVVFTILAHTPWKRVATYSVPAALPECPELGCTCAWGWLANGCGEPNMYMEGFKCKVTGATGTEAVATAKPPVWCEDDTSKCVPGAKQMIFWNQAEGDNIEVDGNDLSGEPKTPTYNTKLGFIEGTQDDIFLPPGTASSTSPVQGPTQTSKPKPKPNQALSLPRPLTADIYIFALPYLLLTYFIH